MNDQILEDFLSGKIGTREFVDTIFLKNESKQGEFILQRNHLLKLCELTIEKKLETHLLVGISNHLIISDYFFGDPETKDGEIVLQTILDWGNPYVNFEINELNLKLWRDYLQTGEYKLRDYNIWNLHIQKQKNICNKYKVVWSPVNPKYKIGISDNIESEPIHGLRHTPDKGTTGWFIWAGEYSTDDDFFKPIHAQHLLERRPDLIKYLGLPSGYRFLVDCKGHEDVWEDKELLKVNSKAP